jgi:Flp pilus assembly protein TadG
MKRNRNDRRGNALATMGLFLLPLMAFLALSVDLGLWAIARTQCQDATDLAALAGVRTLNGNTANGANNNYSAVTPAVQQAATNNAVLGTALQSGQVSVNIGRYVYNSTSQQFEGQFPGPSTTNWSLVQATTNYSVGTSLPFSKVLGISVGSIQSTATAVHRPRDIAIVLDFSGSMRFSSWMGVDNGSGFATNNPDTVVPTFGHYSSVGAGTMYATSFTAPYSAANVSMTTSDGRPPICADFYQDASGTPAFSPASASYATTPGGDNYLTTGKNTSTTWAETAAQVLNIANPGNGTRDATFESQGYAAYSMTSGFHGYTQGPDYYGKTFFIWPPDPTKDWRKLYFYQDGTTNPLNDNSKLWNSNGVWQAPGSNYDINYNAILNFITNVGPNPFPSTMRSGRIVYYTSIPTTIDTSTSPPADLNQRFWKDYIDYVLGLMDNGGFNYQIINNGQTGGTGYGSDINWGTRKITAASSLTGNPKPYMHYGDNPQRPLLNFWFGPMTMIDFLDNYDLMWQVSPVGSRYCWWPGTCHEAPMYACKLGIQAVLSDIQSNHPNDYVSLIMFSVPKSSSTDTGGTRFNGARVGLGQNYSNMTDSLWYPPATVGNANATVTPYDSNNLEVPRAFGGTCYAQPLMLAYNQFNAASACSGYASPAGIAGGNGRKGAQKIVIFETDGAPNTTANASLQNSGSYQSYYKVRYNPASPSGSEYPNSVNGYSDNSGTVTSQIYSICQQIVAADTASPPGYTSGARKVLIHCLGFGPMFAPGSSTAAPNTATLNQMQTIGNVNDGMPSYKIIYGTQTQIINSLQQAFTNILESTVPVSLIQ